MARSTRRLRDRLWWSKLYTFSCTRPAGSIDPHSVEGPGYSRIVYCNKPEAHGRRPVKYPSNYTSTTKYNIITFLPKAIFEQFRRVANLYFLLAAVLSLTPVAPFSAVSMIAPLVFVTGLSMAKEALEDWRRFIQDMKVNTRKVIVHKGNGKFGQKHWLKIRVGDVVKVEKDQFFPADLLLLSSCYEDGICYVETMNLDGETNLKVKRSLEATMILDEDEAFKDFSAVIRCEDPNPLLYTFVGNLEYQRDVFALEPNNLLLRDSKLRNTACVYGVVVFTGHDTKVMQNATKSPSKRSGIERRMDYIIYVLFTALVLISLISSSGFAQRTSREFKVLNLLEFSSKRKRMSVIVQDDTGNILLLCKGADSIIFDRLAKGGGTYEFETSMHLNEYGEAGLRTLALAYRKLETSQYNAWKNELINAKTSIGPDRETQLEHVSDMIERELILVGATAVEDKLQKGVPQCIDKLAQAGLKIWVLTGDKMETAINIGYACSLLRQCMKQISISTMSNEFPSQDAKKAIKDDILLQIQNASQMIKLDKDPHAAFALIIDGRALSYALEDDLKHQFLNLAIDCASVICCRVSPRQKALVTRLVREGTRKTTLAIGDGANDVGMIQEADIAVMASDFSIAQFRFLERLLLVHGHWCYKRIAKMVCYFIYKNIAFGLTLFYFEVYTAFSGQSIYEDLYMLLFNVVLTSLPVIALGVFEQDVSWEVFSQFPALYQQGPKNLFFNWARILGWMSNGLYSSIIIFILNINILCKQAFRESGQTPDLTGVGTTMFTCIIWTVNIQIALTMSNFTWIQHVFIWGSITAWYIFLSSYGAFSGNAAFILREVLGPAPDYWLVTLVVTVVCNLPYLVHNSYQRLFYPLDHHVIQEIKHFKKDVEDQRMWTREKSKARQETKIGFSARSVLKMMIKGLVLEEENMSNLSNLSNNMSNNMSNLTATQTPPAAKKKRNLPGNPDPAAEVIALSPKTLMATNRFICEICNKGFQRDQNLQLHRRGHNLPWKLKQRPTKEVKKKVYICPELSCVHHDPSRALGDLTGIKKHFSRKHGEKKWKCDKCSKKYAVHSDWKAHSKICGTKEYRCDCGTLFSRRDSFITHRAFCDALAEESARSAGIINNQQQHHLLLLSQPSSSSSNLTLDHQISHDQFHQQPWGLMNHIDQMISPSPPPHLSATALLQKAAQMGATMSRPQSQMVSNISSAMGGGGDQKVNINGGDGMTTRDFLGLRAISMHSDMISMSGLDHPCMNSS
ncbi:hypothetical protein J5N97_019305 [Dioscorea zingiberensis]|uniref:Phospholipid-transporting ATPase n=1 Tax=Dioscorea zingiberensis TaxID=325984 RepID=A0A9D5CDL4_9LILI|nr:hypothetical protein J5N97_019305 [Dioscorea zingiberensis]